jgi:hypothetical protein
MEDMPWRAWQRRGHILITALANTRQMARAMFRLGEFNSVSKGGKEPLRSDRSLLSRSLGWLIGGIWVVCQIVLIAWGTLAIYYSNLSWATLRLALAVAFAAFAVWACWVSTRRGTSAVFLGLFFVIVVWWISIPPSHDRPWRPEVAVMPRAIIDGDRVHITGVRNFDYRSRNDFTVRYEEREIRLSHLTALDFFVSYWSEGLAGHAGNTSLSVTTGKTEEDWEKREMATREPPVTLPRRSYPAAGPRGPLDRAAQIAERKYCRPQARPFRLGFPRKVPVFPICPPAAL